MLRAARQERGWSQSDAARRLAELAARAGGTARPGSLKTQLSRWENGHATPAPEHRALLVELYGGTPAELGLEPAAPEAAHGAGDRLRAALARAAALDDTGLELLADQLRGTAALDHRLGTAAAHAALAAQVEQLRELLTHCVDPRTGECLAGLLAGAALLAGDQERDRGAPDLAWRAYALAGEAAGRAGRSDLATLALDRRELLRRELDPPAGDGPATPRRDDPATRPGDPRPARPPDDDADDDAGDDAPAPPAGEEDLAPPAGDGDPTPWPGDDTPAPPPVRIDVQAPPVPLWAELGHDDGGERSVRDRTEAALREAADAVRSGRADDARAAAARARRLALRTGSARTLALLDGLVR